MLRQFLNICHQNSVPLVHDLVLDISVSDHAHGIAANVVHVLAIDVTHESVATVDAAVVVAGKVKVAVVDEVAVEVDEVGVTADEVGVEASTESVEASRVTFLLGTAK